MAKFATKIVSWLGKNGTLGIRPAAATASSNAVTLNAANGVITTEALSTAGAAEYVCTMTNNQVGANDFVLWSVDMGASAGQGVACCATVTAGQVVFVVSNVSASAFDAAIKIKFMIVHVN